MSSRLWRVIFYVLSRRPDLGPDALFSLIFLADFEAYRTLGESITGARWFKLPDVQDPEWAGPMTAQTWPA